MAPKKSLFLNQIEFNILLILFENKKLLYSAQIAKIINKSQPKTSGAINNLFRNNFVKKTIYGNLKLISITLKGNDAVKIYKNYVEQINIINAEILSLQTQINVLNEKKKKFKNFRNIDLNNFAISEEEKQVTMYLKEKLIENHKQRLEL